MPLPEGFNPQYPECPTCGGGMYDNRQTKKSPKQPDFKCKDKECAQALWIESKGANKGASTDKGSSAPPAPILTPEQKKAGRDKVFQDYFGLMSLVSERMQAIAKQKGLVLHMENVQAATYSVYSLLDKKRYLSEPNPKAERLKSPPSEPKPAPVPEPDPYEPEDELPF